MRVPVPGQVTERRSGRRYYRAEDLHRIALIRTWQQIGLMSLDEIGAVLSGGAEGQATRRWTEEGVPAVPPAKHESG